MADVDKHLEKAEALLAKNKLDAALPELKAAYEDSPGNLALLQQIAELCVKLKRDDEAGWHFSELFDLAASKGDAKRAMAVYAKLEGTSLSPEKVVKYGDLLIKQGLNPEAIKAFEDAAERFEKAGNGEGAMGALGKLAHLDPDKADIQVRLGDEADKVGNGEIASKAFLRAGQLTRPDDLDQAVVYLKRAHDLNSERTTALALGEVLVDKGENGRAIDLLLPVYKEGDKDPGVMETLGSALVAENRMGEAEEIIMTLQEVKPESYELLFALAKQSYESGDDAKGQELLGQVREICTRANREKEYGERLEKLYATHTTSLSLGEFVATYFSESNRETQYERILDGLFKAYLASDKNDEAANCLDRLIDIDPYDFKNQGRFKELKGRLPDKRYKDMAERISADVGGDGSDEDGGGGATAEAQSLDDLMVQVELFIQYNLQSKAAEKLKEIAELYPGVEVSNPRLMSLYEQLDVRAPGGVVAPPTAAPAAAPADAPAAAPAAAPQETVSDLAKISEITHGIFRKSTPKEIIHTGISELGKYLGASRSLGIVGKKGSTPSVTVEHCAAGVPQSPPAVIKKLLEIIYALNLDKETGAISNATLSPELKQCGVQSLFAMPLMDPEKGEQEGLIVFTQTDSERQWKPNEVYLAKAVADQAQAAIGHTKLRSMMSHLSVGEAGGGLLGRSVYLDTMMSVIEHAKKQGTPLVVALFELDSGKALLREAGEQTVEKTLEKAGEILIAQVRQNDMAFRHTGTSLAVILGDTTMEKCRRTIDKIRRMLCTVKLDGQDKALTFCGAASEAAVRTEYESADIVIDVVNRAEFSLDQAREKGNTVVV